MNDDLREQLRRADPAASLRPITPEAVSRLLENTMTKQSATRPRLLVAAAAMVLLAVSAAVLIFGGGRKERVPQPVAAPTTQSVTRLSIDDGATSGKCRAPEAERLAASAQLAFEGTVLRIEGRVVTLAVKHVWTGVRTELVEVTQVDEHTAALLAGSILKVGETYIIAATADGQVMSCDYSGLADLQRRALFDAAF